LKTIKLAVASILLAAATAAVAKDGNHPLFATGAPLTVTLDAPWGDLFANKNTTRRHAAKLTYTAADGQAHPLAATVEARGLTRRRVCRFPPLKLRFDKAAVDGSEFDGQDELKLVTHCDTAPGYADYYVQELVAYRIYNLVTDASFRVRPLEVTYRQPDGGKPNGPRFGFLIEDLGDVAKRNDLKRDERATFLPDAYDPAAMSRLALFEYLLGNTDWDVMKGPRKDACCHNTRALGREAGGGLVPVPYDFDSAGFVNAEYAAPDPSLKLADVRERVFRGFCLHNAALPAARSEFLAKRQAITDLIRNEARLDARRQRSLLGYVEAFYAVLDSDEKFAREITGACRK
jgi:hypothetical protein